MTSQRGESNLASIFRITAHSVISASQWHSYGLMRSGGCLEGRQRAFGSGKEGVEVSASERPNIAVRPVDRVVVLGGRANKQAASLILVCTMRSSATYFFSIAPRFANGLFPMLCDCAAALYDCVGFDEPLRGRCPAP